MKITDIQVLPIHNWLFVQVHTDTGLTGLGESGVWGYLEASGAVVESFKRYLIGQDPLRIEHHWQYLYRNVHFRGAAIMGALSAIDIALWDIAGKHLQVPCWQLLGGKVRDKARVYYHVLGSTREKLIEGCRQARENGFTAVGHLTPFLDESRDKPYEMTHTHKIHDAIEAVAAYRQAVGDEVDLCVEIHRRLEPHEAIALARGIEPYRPMFLEDPIRPDSFDAMAEVARKCPIPIATGERLHTIWEFQALLSRRAVQYVRPDVCLCGGLTHARKIAALAEAHHVGVVPHNPLSPVSTAACIQLAAAVPNFVIQEYPKGEHQPPKSEIVRGTLRCEDGYLIIPDTPGLGVELVEGAAEKHPPKPRRLITRLHADGSVVDQ
ncbi:MAG: galactonate dehydratase [Planctomycetota bacterium]